MPTAKLTCTKNVTVSSKYTSKSYRNGYLAFGRGSGGDEYRLLLDFTAATDTIPAGVTVESATLVVPKTTGDIGSNAGFTAQACRITAAWTTSATWDSGNPSYTETGAATADTGTGHSGNVSFDVTSIVQAWVKGTATQRGIVLRKSTSGGTYIKVAKELGAYINVTYAYQASTFTTDGKATAGTAEGITITADSSALTHDLVLTFGGSTWTLATGKTAAQLTSWTASTDVCKKIPNDVSGTGKLTLTTYNGDTKIGSTSKDVTISVPSSAVPTIGTLTATIAGSSVAAGWGLYVKNHSRVKLTLSSASGALGSEIASITYSGNGWSASTTALNATSAVLTKAGSLAFTITAKDSRGRTSAAKTVTINVEDYAAPSISKASAVRADANGAAAGDGTYILVEATATNASVGGKNALTVNASVSPGGWSGTLSDGQVLLGGGNASVSLQYIVTVTATDSLGGKATRTVTVFTASRPINITQNGDGVAIGGYATADMFTSFLPASFPAGVQPNKISPSELDAVVEDGYYRIINESVSIGGVTSGYWYIHVTRYSSKNCVQECYPVTEKRYKVLRWQYDGEWVTEWENPPMATGVEYRTTERDNGNPVFVKRVQYEFSSTIGNASATTTTNIAHGISDFNKLVRCHGRLSGVNYQFPYLSTSGGLTAVSAVNATNIVVRISNMTWSANTFQFDVYCTKT